MAKDVTLMTTEELEAEIGFLKTKLLAVYGRECNPPKFHMSDWERLQELKAEYGRRPAK